MMQSITASGPVWIIGSKWEVEVEFDYDSDGKGYKLNSIHLVGIYSGQDNKPYSLPINVPLEQAGHSIDGINLPQESKYGVDAIIQKRLVFLQKPDEE